MAYRSEAVAAAALRSRGRVLVAALLALDLPSPPRGGERHSMSGVTRATLDKLWDIHA
jgi:hypothetical protein